MNVLLFTADPPCVDRAVLFFGAEGESPELMAFREEAAKAVCARCPARRRCLDFALAENIRAGVWGGFGEAELTNLRRSLSARGRHLQRQEAA